MDSEDKIVTYTDIVNIARLNGIGGIDTSVSERLNCLELLEHPGFVGFNWENVLGPSALPPGLQEKLVDTSDEISLIYMDEWMRKRFEDNPFVLSLDSTHCTNRAGFPLVTVLVRGKNLICIIFF